MSMKSLNKTYNILLVIFLSITLFGQSLSRKEIIIPDILGYKTLKGDFHIHTVFSDGLVWPSLRVEEAWYDGLDAIAITDHLEYRPHKEFVTGDFNSSFNIAKQSTKNFNLIVIQGAEITRSMPPGHFNALFIKDANQLIKENWKDVFEEVKKQDGIVVWNHPGWIAQQPDGIAKWYDEHTWIYNLGIMKGLEIVNETNYYPEVHQWCLDKNITMMGNTDAHLPTTFFYNKDKGEHRTITLLFVKEKSESGIREAIEEGRTAVWSEQSIYGKEEFLQAIFAGSVNLKVNNVHLKGKERVYLELQNRSDLNFDLELINTIPEVQFPNKIDLKARETVIFSFRATKDNIELNKEIEVLYKVKNMFISPLKCLIGRLPIKIQLEPVK